MLEAQVARFSFLPADSLEPVAKVKADTIGL